MLCEFGQFQLLSKQLCLCKAYFKKPANTSAIVPFYITSFSFWTKLLLFRTDTWCRRDTEIDRVRENERESERERRHCICSFQQHKKVKNFFEAEEENFFPFLWKRKRTTKISIFIWFFSFGENHFNRILLSRFFKKPVFYLLVE